jgi:hypothetical protein
LGTILGWFLILITIFGYACNTQAQIAFELFSTRKYASQEVFWEKSFSDSSKWSIFNYARFQIDYSTQEKNEFFSYNTVNYLITNHLSGAIGGYLTKEGFVPVIAANYFQVKENWNLSIFPSIELKANPFYEIFFFTQIRPKINDRWHLFSQLIGSANFNFSQHRFSELLVRLGVQRKYLQFGLGTNARLFRIVEDGMPKQVFENNVGVFLRTEL